MHENRYSGAWSVCVIIRPHMTPMGNFICSVCGQSHEGVPLSWGPEDPDMWGDLPSEGRQERGELGTDQCVIDDQHFFIRGRVEIPLTDMSEKFAWLIWVEVSAADFDDMHKKWNQEGRESTAPYSARLANHLTLYRQPTIGLRVKLQTMPVGTRPLIEIVGDHQLHREQINGISSHDVQQIAQRILSGAPSPPAPESC